MQTACSACGGPIPPSGAYTVAISLPETSARRSRVVGIACRPACLARLAAEMQAAAAARAERQAGRYAGAASIMAARPRGR